MSEEAKGMTNIGQLGAYVLIVALAIFGFWRIEENQQETDRDFLCTYSALSGTLNAVNERTTYSREQAEANIKLQRSQAEFLRIVITPPKNDDGTAGSVALREYFDALTKFNDLAMKTASKAQQYPYPDAERYAECVGIETDKEETQ